MAVSSDSTKAYVTLQEANSIAVVDLTIPAIVDIWPLEFVDRSQVPFDASNKDDSINVRLWPNVYGMPQPDSINYADIHGTGYLFVANEGDAKEYDNYYVDEIRAADIGYARFDPAAFSQYDIETKAELGRLKVSQAAQDLPLSNIDTLYHFGGRSFTIVFANNGSQVFNSGSDFEDITANPVHGVSTIFNCGDDNLDFDDRSDDKGPEPEAIVTCVLDGKDYVFITLERVGGVVMYNIDDPSNPQFVTYFNNRSLTQVTGDLDPEGLVCIEAKDSPTGETLLIVNGAVTGDTSVYCVSQDDSSSSP